MLTIRSSCNSGYSEYHALATAFVLTEIANGGVAKSFVFQHSKDQGNDITTMRRQRPSQQGTGPNGQTDSGGSVTQEKQQVRFTAILTSLQQTGRVSVERSVSNWTSR